MTNLTPRWVSDTTVAACVCVCAREREREREILTSYSTHGLNRLTVGIFPNSSSCCPQHFHRTRSCLGYSHPCDDEGTDRLADRWDEQTPDHPWPLWRGLPNKEKFEIKGQVNNMTALATEEATMNKRMTELDVHVHVHVIKVC